MFSDHLQKFEKISGETLFCVAAGLVILCQLVAMALVADGQVQKAQLRDARQAAETSAMAQCMDASTIAARQGCIQQARADAMPVHSADTVQSGRMLASGSEGSTSETGNWAKPMHSQIQGLMPLALANR